MPTTIQITPPGGTAQTIRLYDKCVTTLSATNRAGSFALQLPDTTGDMVDLFTVGSDVQITQDGNLFRGWVLNPGKQLDGQIRNIEISGADYTARTQKVVVTESYVGQAVDFIVADLFTKYLPWATATNISACSKAITIKFADKFFFDSMEQLAEISGYEWYIDELLDGHFFPPSSRINSNVLTTDSFWKGSASLKPDASKLVNKLWVKGGKALSDDFTQAITVSGATPIPLYYKPRATTSGVVVTIGGVSKTVGIQNLTTAGTTDFLLNFEEKLLVPDLCTSGTGTIVYRYEYPIKILLEEPTSRAQYGLWEDILKVDTDDRDIAYELGLRHLAKYSQPVTAGGIRPFAGTYRPGELVKVEIPRLNVNEYLQIKEVVYDSVPAQARVERTLQLESPERDAGGIMKDLNRRLAKLEKQVYQDEDGPVERYIAREEAWGWSETVTETVHACPIPCDDTPVYFGMGFYLLPPQLLPADDLYPC